MYAVKPRERDSGALISSERIQLEDLVSPSVWFIFRPFILSLKSPNAPRWYYYHTLSSRENNRHLQLYSDEKHDPATNIEEPFRLILMCFEGGFHWLSPLCLSWRSLVTI
jgi:hypothetical protein